MKKVLALFLSIIMLLSITVGIDFSAHAETSGVYNYEVLDDGTVLIIGCTSPCTYINLSVPNTLDGYVVSSIGDSAFSVSKSLRSATIPDCITNIGKKIFASSSGLERITVDNNNPVYDSRNDCNAIIETESNTLICGCQTTVIPNSVTSIGSSAFYSCTNLTSITIPNSVTSIGDTAFFDCHNLSSITIPDSVESIGEDAFESCTALENITIPNSLTSIASLTFYNCKNLTDVYYNGTLNEWNKISISDGNTYLTSAKIHTWENETATKEATCTETGIKTYTCPVCEDTKTEIIPATGHKVVTDNAVEPTCTPAGKTAGSHCSVCNAIIKPQNTIPATEHSYDNGKVTKAATCTANGVKTYTCSVCKATVTETIKSTGHKAVTDKAVAPTCTTAGKTAGSHCSVCNAVITAQKTVPATGHSYDNGKVTKAATCTVSGVKTYTCAKCKDTKTEVIPATGHSYDAGKVTKNATCKVTGVKTFTCSKCKATKTETIAKTNTHSYKTTTTKATTSKNGSVVTKCTVCGKVSKNTAIAYPKTITLSATSYTYDGKVKKPTVTVKDSAGKKIAASNYTVTYANGRKNVGTYKVTIKFKGNYSGTVTKTFTIKPKATTLSSVTAGKKKFTAKWRKQATQTTGYEIQYSTDKNFKKNNKTVTVSKNGTTSKAVSKLTAKKKYYVRVRTYKTVGKTKIYSNWSASKAVTTKK